MNIFEKMLYIALSAPMRVREWLYCKSLQEKVDCGKNVTFLPTASIDGVHVSIGDNSLIAGEITAFWNGFVDIGEDCYVGPGTRIVAKADITIGDHVLISHGVTIADEDQNKIHSVHIEDDVWVGFDCSILPGTHIGKCAIIGAGSVVVGEIPAYALVVGNPARVFRIDEYAQA